MILTQPARFAEAIASQQVRALLPTSASAADLATLPTSIHQRALCSARTQSARHLSMIDRIAKQIVNPDFVDGRPRLPGEYMSLPKARALLRASLKQIGYHPDDIDAVPGTLKDLGSYQRMNLIIDTQTKMARGYGQYAQGQTPAILDQFPCQELVRFESREIPRDWITRWLAEGGQLYGGRMIARKDARIWIDISQFGQPYPPFDYNSGMALRDVDRDEAMSLGVIGRDDIVAPDPIPYNDTLQASSPTDPVTQPRLHKAIIEAMGNRVSVVDGVLHFLDEEAA